MSNYIVTKITDPKLLDFLYKYIPAEGAYVAVGFFKDFYLGKKIKDIDLYFQNHTAFERTAMLLKAVGLEKKYTTDNVTLYSNGAFRVDCVSKIFGSPEEIIAKFDFTVCKFAAYKQGNFYYVIHHKDFFFDLHSKKLSTADAPLDYPAATFKRLVRYIKYGFEPDDNTLLDIVLAINTADEAELYNNFYEEVAQ